MISTAVVVTAATLGCGLAAALALRLLPTVRLQLAGLALLAVVLPLSAVLASGWVMFHMHDDVKILAVSAASAFTAVAGALLLARWILGPLERLRAAAARIAAGDLGATAPEGGPTELADVGASFNAMARSLEGLFDSRRELVAWASHDLRAPLASMQAMLEATQDGLAAPGEYTDELHRQVRLLSAIVDDLLNLLANALRHTPADGAVAVVVRSEGGSVLVAVDDTGSGLPPGAADLMFDSFWRGDSARSDEGAGLGLAIARGLVRAHGGTIWAESRPEGGARVAFTLPI